jgi:hypothetical protein
VRNDAPVSSTIFKSARTAGYPYAVICGSLADAVEVPGFGNAFEFVVAEVDELDA